MTHACLLGPAGFIAGAGLPLTDRGFRYGMSVFETIALRDSAPLLPDAHFARLAAAASAANFRPPAGWEESARALLSAPPIVEGVARIYITAGDHDKDVSRVAALFEEMEIPTTLGRASASTVMFTPPTPFGKTGNYWPHFLARPANGNEAILCSPDGHLLGGAMSNLVLLIDGSLVTPRTPVRHGVVCDWLGATGAELRRSDLPRATSAFLTNSRMGLCVLTSIDGHPLAVDPLVEDLWQRYRAEVLRAG